VSVQNEDLMEEIAALMKIVEEVAEKVDEILRLVRMEEES
jgi:hypothetical protein